MSKKDGQKKGSVYILILSSVLVITVLSIAGITFARYRTQRLQWLTDSLQAQRLSSAGLQLAFEQITTAASWRTGTSMTLNKSLSPKQDFIQIEITDPADKDMLNTPTDSVLVQAVGIHDNAIHMAQATVQFAKTPLTCLQSVVHAQNNMVFNTATNITGTGALSTNADAVASFAWINLSVNAADTVSGMFYNAGMKTGATALSIPDYAEVIAEYSRIATIIKYAAIPSGLIQDVVFSSTSNPYGSTLNAQGVYLIDLAGQQIAIKNIRLVGTLILKNGPVGKTIDLSGAMVIEPTVNNYPTLIIDGAVRFKLDKNRLDESQSNTNFNPIGTPYNGIDDKDTLDRYDTQINGLVYVTQDIVIKNSLTFNGVMLAGNTVTFDKSSIAKLTYDKSFSLKAPPAFNAYIPSLQSGSISRVVDP